MPDQLLSVEEARRALTSMESADDMDVRRVLAGDYRLALLSIIDLSERLQVLQEALRLAMSKGKPGPYYAFQAPPLGDEPGWRVTWEEPK